MAKYRKKPIVIDAFRLGHNSMPDWFMNEVSKNAIVLHGDEPDKGKVYCDIETLEGVMRGSYGDWIIQGVQGEIYPCKHDIFIATYDKELN